MATRTISKAGGNWKDTTAWAEGVVPTAADDVVATAESGNLTLTETGRCKSIDFTNYTKTFTHNAGVSLAVEGNETGFVKFVPAMTYVVGSATSSIDFAAGGTNPAKNLTTAGKELGKISISQCNLVLKDNLNLKGEIFGGNAFHIDASAATEVTLQKLAKTSLNGTSIKNGNTVWNITGTSGVVFELSGEGGVIFEEGEKATIKIVTASASSRTITFATNTIGTITYEVNGSAGTLMLTHTNATVNTINVADASSAKSLQLSATRTLKVINFNVKGVSGKLITVKSQTGGSQTKLEKTSGVIECDYLSLQDCKAQGGALWFAGKNSTNVSGNEGWLFGARVKGEATLTASASLSAAAVRRRCGAASVSAQASLSAESVRRRRASCTLEAKSELKATLTRRRLGESSLSASTTLSGAMLRRRTGEALLEANSFLSGDGVKRKYGRAQLSSTADMQADQPVRRRQNEASMEAVSDLKAVAKRKAGASYNGIDGSTYEGGEGGEYGA